MDVDKRKNISDKTKSLLWAMSAGRCENCGRLIYKHPASGEIDNFSQIAHDIPVSPGAVRHNEKYKLLDIGRSKDDIDNLLLLCYDCHKMIDNPKNAEKYTFEKLQQIKKTFEKDILIRTNSNIFRSTKIVDYTCYVNGQITISSEDFKLVISQKNRYAADTIRIGSMGVNHKTWNHEFEKQNLINNFGDQIKLRDNQFNPNHFSVFALAPIPHLVLLGSLFTSFSSVDIYQRNKDTSDWYWITDNETENLKIKSTCVKQGSSNEICLLMSISSAVVPSTIPKSIDVSTCSTYQISIDNPNQKAITSIKHLNTVMNEYRIT